MKKLIYSVPLFLLVIGLASRSSAQSTAFTYHGVLSFNRTPVTGLYDMQFSVYGAETGGAIVAGPLPKNAVPVTNGLFTARLDFANVFTGPARWIEVSVRPAGGGNFQTLSPRQELTSSPYSIRSLTAADVANGSVVKSLNNLKDNVTLQGTGNVTLTPNGNTILIGAPGGPGGPWSLNGSSAFYNGGNVGIGTSTPANKLTVLTPTLGYGVEHTDGDTRVSTFVGRGSGWFGTLSNHKLTLFANDNGFPHMTATLDTIGNFGIGTDSPANKLTVRTLGEGFGDYGIEHTDGNVRLGTFLRGSTGGGWLGTLSTHPLTFFVNNSGFPHLTMTLDTAGNVGIGTQTPTSKLTVFQPSTPLTANYGVEHTDGTVRLSTYLDGSGGWLGTVSSHPLNFYVANGAPSMTVDTMGNVGVGTRTPQAKLHVVGTVRTSVLTITGGADIAEPFKMSSDEIPKGSVVVIDEQNPGHLKLSTEVYDTRVAGVVSGANGIKPGISLHQEGAIEGGENVALSGRVYVRADATTGAIKPGDLLTTSATPGHAMKVLDHSRAQGAILGKAMISLEEGKGTVLILVTLQ